MISTRERSDGFDDDDDCEDDDDDDDEKSDGCGKNDCDEDGDCNSTRPSPPISPPIPSIPSIVGMAPDSNNNGNTSGAANGDRAPGTPRRFASIIPLIPPLILLLSPLEVVVGLAILIEPRP